MNLAQLAEEFGTTPAVIRQLFPDIIPANYRDEWDIASGYLPIMRQAWNEKFGVNTPFGGKAPDFVIDDNADYGKSAYPAVYTPSDSANTMRAWRELRVQLGSETTNRWAVTIDPFDQLGMIYVMVTLHGEMKWSDRGPELYNLLVRTTAFLKDAMK